MSARSNRQNKNRALNKIAIVGASLAGARAAEALRLRGYEGEVVLIGEETLLPYERPPLSKESLFDPDPVPLWVHEDDFYSKAQISLRLGERAETLALRERFEVSLAGGGCLEADAVLLTTGGKPRKLADTPASSRVHYLRDWADAVKLRRALSQPCRVAVIGSGFIGAEVASSAASMGCEVNIIEALPQHFPGVKAEAVHQTLSRVFESSGIRITPSALVTSIKEYEHAVSITTSQGLFEADLVVVGIGIEPAVELAQTVGATVHGGVLVNEVYETSIQGLFAAGDVATRIGRDGGRKRTEHWRSAQEQGAAAAAGMLGEEPPELSLPWCWSDQLGHRAEIAGEPSAGDRQVVRSMSETELCVFHLRDGFIVGATGLNARREIRAATKLIQKGLMPSPDELSDLSCPVAKVKCLQQKKSVEGF